MRHVHRARRLTSPRSLCGRRQGNSCYCRCSSCAGGNGRIAWQMGYSVLTAGSDEAALIRLAEREQRPDLIISDYHLASGKTGIRAIEQINAAFGSSIPAILISGDTAAEPLRDAKERGYILLHKPVDPMRLRAVMHELLRDHD